MINITYILSLYYEIKKEVTYIYRKNALQINEHNNIFGFQKVKQIQKLCGLYSKLNLQLGTKQRDRHAYIHSDYIDRLNKILRCYLLTLCILGLCCQLH